MDLLRKNALLASVKSQLCPKRQAISAGNLGKRPLQRAKREHIWILIFNLCRKEDGGRRRRAGATRDYKGAVAFVGF